LINRYYDPTTDQFLSVDPKVSQTDQPYVFAGDSPLNATDPLGDVTRCQGTNCGIGTGYIRGPSGETACSQNCGTNYSFNSNQETWQYFQSGLAVLSVFNYQQQLQAQLAAQEIAAAQNAERAALQSTAENNGGILGAFQSLSKAVGGGPQMSQVPFGNPGGGTCAQGAADGEVSWAGLGTASLFMAIQVVPGVGEAVDYGLLTYVGTAGSGLSGCAWEVHTGQSTP
jgi:hypothetical protein